MSHKFLADIKAQYHQGKIEKARYITLMHQIHQYLFEYALFIKDTDIVSIEITDNLVMMTTKAAKIKLIADKDDQRIIPIEILNFGSYEKDNLKMILKLIKKNHIVLDIGANIGWYSINIAKAVSGVQIFAFEPIPESFAYLTTNLQLNQITNVQTYNFGFYHQEKHLPFYYYQEGLGNASSQNLSNRKDVSLIYCKVKKLDNFIKEKKIKVDFIKCDVEGAELSVFQGGIESIKKYKPIIFCEMLRKWSIRFGYHPNDIIKLLAHFGYQCFTVERKKLKRFIKMDKATSDTNFFFLQTGKHTAIIHRFL